MMCCKRVHVTRSLCDEDHILVHLAAVLLHGIMEREGVELQHYL